MKKPSKGDAFQGEQRLYQIVARRLARMIEESRHEPSWRLPGERDLAEMLEVSRPVIREAVIALEVQGVVAVRGRSGITILPQADTGSDESLADADIFDLLQARNLLEPGVARVAATRAESFDFTVLGGLVERMAAGGAENFVEASMRFFATISQIAGNPVLRSMSEALLADWLRSPFLNRFGPHLFSPERVPLWIGDHHAILSALTMRQPEAAARAVSRHLDNISGELRLIISKEEDEDERGRSADARQEPVMTNRPATR
ncbi:FadR/GntR family transcriptional regulator [Martelella endophytica]|uniref:FadR/GntR family transcriptional regulator n=1 Tax=Martelella endophytica TaxID=1486262 RepID=UPI0005F1A442|nr:FadR/GntR family transcriptional regulator [Martelella endophytica]